MSIYRLGEKHVQFGANVWVAPNANVIGNVHLATDSSVWWNATLRGDNDPIYIGERTIVQDGSVLLTDEGFSLSIGNDVTIGHLVMLHGCMIGNCSLIGIGSVILNGSVIGNECIVGANTLIPEGKLFPDRVLIVGSPGKVIRELREEEVAGLKASAAHYVANAQRYRTALQPL